MVNSKLIDLLSSLNSKEIKLISKLIYSPAYNQHKDVVTLFEYISQLNKFTIENLDRKTVFSKVFPKERYNDLKLRHVISYLLRVCEDGLVHQEVFSHELHYQITLLKGYREHGLSRHFKNDLLLLKKNNQSNTKWSRNSYHSYAQIYAEAAQAENNNTKLSATYLQESDRLLNYYFVLSKLKNACGILAADAEIDLQINSLFNEVIRMVEKDNLLQRPEIECYYFAFWAFKQADQMRYFRLFKEKICTHAERLEKEELKELFALAIQFCTKKVAQYETEYEAELFEIYLHGLATEALLNNQKLSYQAQKNIVDLGLKLHEITWVQDFITDSKQLTDKAFREELFLFNSAKLAAARNDLKTALALVPEEKIKHQVIIHDVLLFRITLWEILGNASEQKRAQNKLKVILKKNLNN